MFIGPNCGFYTAGHPIDAEQRNSGLEYAKPIKVGSDVWIGGNVCVMPGVTIGDNVVIGLYMAQPNLSKAIKELENSLGITIFRRTSKGVIPTDQGVKFLACAKQVLMQIDNMEAIGSPDKPRERKMRISVPRAGYISRALSGVHRRFGCL